ncbi:HEPN domain-containing protein [Nodosilinea sp. PGN35]|uniref:HEPN domain-containing protein n=1 Tax=Nodosilinea sp. PGN35 TaxID=3020489 RepID=UPI0023B2A4A9|nr:HEPN domain-containing protein [Nodosilinea sp. TSF1-S3]MDF0365465.1 HEPN domain-containing protein [Nodosilinea sp. TSF1-S3]
MVDDKQAEVEKWLKISRRDLQSARTLLKALILENVVFHCQQSAEKTLKAYLVHQDIVFPKTHDLDILLDLCSQADADFRRWDDAADVLTPYATQFRYPSDSLEPEEEDAQQAIDLAASILDFVMQKLP